MKQRRRVCGGVLVPNEEDVFRGYTNGRIIIIPPDPTDRNKCAPTAPAASTTAAPRRSAFGRKRSPTRKFVLIGSEPHPSTNRAHDGVGVELHGVFVGRTGQREGPKPPRRVEICVCKAFVGYIGVSLAGVRLCIGAQVQAGWKTKFTDSARDFYDSERATLQAASISMRNGTATTDRVATLLARRPRSVAPRDAATPASCAAPSGLSTATACIVWRGEVLSLFRQLRRHGPSITQYTRIRVALFITNYKIGHCHTI